LAAPYEALPRQGRRRQPGHAGPADLKPFGPGAVRQELQAPSGLAEGDAEGRCDLVRVKSEHPASRCGSAEHAAGGGWMEAAGVVVARRQCQRDSASDLIPCDDPRQHVGAAGARHLTGRQRCRNHRAARMQRPGRMRVVKVERVAQGAVQQRGTGWGVAGAIAEYAAVARRQAERPSGGQQRRRAFRVMPSAHDVAHEVEHQEPRPLRYRWRQCRG